MACLVDWEMGMPAWTGWKVRGGDLVRLLEGPAGGLAVTRGGAIAAVEPAANRVLWLSPAGSPMEVGGAAGFCDGQGRQARFRRPVAVAAAGDEAVLVADRGNHAIRRIDADGTVTTVAGGIYGSADGPARTARFAHPAAVAVSADGAVLVADTGNNTVRRIDGYGTVTTVAGCIRGQGDPGPGPPSFREPAGLAVDVHDTVYVADTGNHRICRALPSGLTDVFAGRPPGGLADGPGVRAAFRWPGGLAVGADGTVYVADTGNGLLRQVDPGGTVHTIGGEPGWRPTAVALLGDDHLVVAETRWAPYQSIGRLRLLSRT